MSSTIRRLALAALLGVSITAAGGSAAQAHVDLVSSSPAAGSVTGLLLRKVSVRFSGPIRSGTLKVFRVSNGKKVSIGNGGRDPQSVRKLLTRLRSGLAPGRMRVRWTVVSADGHREAGTFTFRMRRR